MHNIMQTCWVITADKKGTIHQAIGIPERLDIKYELKIVKLNGLTKFLGHISPKLLFFCSQINLLSRQKMPTFIVSSGHDGLIVAAALKARKPDLIVVHVQNPKGLLKYFDLAVIPQHDNVAKAANIITTKIGLHHINEIKLQQEKAKFIKQFGGAKAAFFSIGGKSVGYDLTDEWVAKFCQKLSEFNSIKVYVTTARRTSEKHRLYIKNNLPNNAVFLDDYSYNYYIGALAFCDYIFVTNESVSMVSEACFTKKTIVMMQIYGFRKKIKQFNDVLQKSEQAVLQKIDDLHLIESLQNNSIEDNEIVSNAIKNLLKNDK